MEVNSESTYWGGEIKKSISQVILGSIYLKVKAAIFNLAASGQLSIHKPVTTFPSKNPFASQPLKFSTGLNINLARLGLEEILFWHPQALLALTGCPGPQPLQRRCPSPIPWLWLWPPGSTQTSLLPCPFPEDQGPFLATLGRQFPQFLAVPWWPGWNGAPEAPGKVSCQALAPWPCTKHCWSELSICPPLCDTVVTQAQIECHSSVVVEINKIKPRLNSPRAWQQFPVILAERGGEKMSFCFKIWWSV